MLKPRDAYTSTHTCKHNIKTSVVTVSIFFITITLYTSKALPTFEQFDSTIGLCVWNSRFLFTNLMNPIYRLRFQDISWKLYVTSFVKFCFRFVVFELFFVSSIHLLDICLRSVFQLVVCYLRLLFEFLIIFSVKYSIVNISKHSTNCVLSTEILNRNKDIFKSVTT